jgi:hypothetical protein
MAKKDEIKAEMDALSSVGLKLAESFLKKEGFKSFAYDYQGWYTKALKVVESLAPDRIADFRGYYQVDPKRKMLSYGTYVIEDYLKGIKPAHVADFDSIEQTAICFVNQLSILEAVVQRADSVLKNIEGALYTNLQADEIEVARKLAKINLRAAGALVGVVIEGHLQKVAASHAVKIAKKNPTIADLNEPLRAADVIDLPTWRKIGYLADLRNLCSHKKDREPTEGDVDELIKGAEWVSKNVS